MLGSRLPAVLAGFLFLLLIGCGPTRYQPPGKITKGGAPLQVSDKAVIQLAFFAEGDSKFESPYPVDMKKDGTFTITGRDGGIPAGKYVASLAIIDPYPDGKDILGGNMKHGKGPQVEVKGQSEVVVDIPK
jgi:hypothetical protein